MPDPGSDALADRRQLVVILRLVAATTGRLLYGEVVDVETGPTGRFSDLRGMTAAIRSWLADEMIELPDSDERNALREPDIRIEH